MKVLKSIIATILEFDILFIIIISLTFFGIAFQCSAAESWKPWAESHLQKGLTFLPILFIIQFIKPKTIKNLAYPLYIINLLLLIFVAIFGFIGMGAQRWIDLYVFKLQPSEFVKISLILFLARYYADINPEQLPRLRTHIIPIFATLIPFILVAKQPDLGTGIIILSIAVFSIFISGIHFRYILLSAIGISISMPYIWSKLYDYQKQRILTFLNPESDPLGSGYHVIQSKIAIGSAGMYGKGYFQGTQSKLNFLPEKHTDFIFATISEETGFIGSIFIVFLFSLLIYFTLKIAFRSNNNFHRLIAANIAFLIFVHVFINIGMVLGILPVVGVPLPLISYGGSSLLSFAILFGILIHIGRNRYTKF